MKNDTSYIFNNTDASCVGIVDDEKSTSGGEFYLWFFLVSWVSKKHTFVSLFTSKIEYIVVEAFCTQVLWMKNLCKIWR